MWLFAIELIQEKALIYVCASMLEYAISEVNICLTLWLMELICVIHALLTVILLFWMRRVSGHVVGNNWG